MDYYKKIMEIIENEKINTWTRNDVLKRCEDWFSMNGKKSDAYIERQYNYLLSIINK